jgi:hypothetical protein
MIRKLVAVSAATLVAAAGGAAAQTVWLAPTYGEIALETGFAPDPHTVQVQAGGEVDASALPAENGVCIGYISDAPSYRVTLEAGDLPLIISVVAEADAVLVVNGPDKRWYCNDDANFSTLDPAVTFDPAVSGPYDIWVGTWEAGPSQPATLYISELSAGIEQGPQPINGALIDAGLPPVHGQASLTWGFLPDPHEVEVEGGGSVQVETVAAGCAGFTGQAPDYVVDYAAGFFPLFISATSAADTTLVVGLPDGTFVCNDDRAADDLDPQLRIDGPASGRYAIWVGTFNEAGADATLSVSELE